MATSTELQEGLAELLQFTEGQKAAAPELLRTGTRQKETRGDRYTNQLNLRNRGPADFLRESLAGNVQQVPGLVQLANLISGSVADTTAEGTARGAELFSGLTKDSARSAGVDIEGLTAALQGIGLQNFQSGQRTLDDANALIDGSFFNTAVGQQNLQNLQGQLAPGLSPAGLGSLQSTFGGATSKGEVDSVTAFLRNAIQERDTGFGLRQQGMAAKDAAASRLGGVLTFGTQFGQSASQFGGSFGQGVGNLNSQLIGNQLLTPSQFAQDTNLDLADARGRLEFKEMQKAQDDAASAANAAGVGSAVGQIARLALAPFTGGASLALTAASSGAGGAGGIS